MRRFPLLIALSFVIALCGSSGAAVLVLFPDGHYVSKPNLAAANTAADVAGAKVVVTGPETVPSDFVWRSDAKLAVEKSGSIVVTGGPTIAGPFETGPIKIISGGANITKNLPTAIGNPPAAWTSRVDTITSGTGDDLGFVSQITSGTDTPPIGSPRVSQNLVAGYFAGYNGAHSAAFHTVLNPILMLTVSDTGTVNTNGTAVTWVKGAVFRADWLGGQITINNLAYAISAVNSSTSLTLATSAGVQNGVTYYAGSGGNAMEVDISSVEDASNSSDRAANGIIVGSGGTAKARTGVAVLATNSPTNAWVNGAVFAHYSDYGIYLQSPASPAANGAYITNGAIGSTTITRGNPTLVLTGADKNLLRITPSIDNPPQVVVYGTNAANATVNWSITQGGRGSFTTLTLTNLPVFADNAAAKAGGLTINQVYRTPTGVLMIVY